MTVKAKVKAYTLLILDWFHASMLRPCLLAIPTKAVELLKPIIWSLYHAKLHHYSMFALSVESAVSFY